MKDQGKKLTVSEFTLLAITKLAKPERQTIHTVYSGFNQAFRDYFSDKDPVKEIKALAEAGTISFRLCRGGAIIANPGVITSNSDSKDALKKMGLEQ
jgi:hypothetical protein